MDPVQVAGETVLLLPGERLPQIQDRDPKLPSELHKPSSIFPQKPPHFLSAGKGDMLVWATKDGRFGYGKVSFGKDENVTLTLDKLPGHTESIALDIVPPVDGSIPAEVTEEQKAANALRLHQAE